MLLIHPFQNKVGGSWQGLDTCRKISHFRWKIPILFLGYCVGYVTWLSSRTVDGTKSEKWHFNSLGLFVLLFSNCEYVGFTLKYKNIQLWLDATRVVIIVFCSVRISEALRGQNIQFAYAYFLSSFTDSDSEVHEF